MIIDFRIRPPYKSFMDLKIVKNWQNVDPDPRKTRPTGFERRPVASMAQASVDLMVREMDDAGITRGVLMGRHTGNPVYGDADNAHVHELMERFPGRFIGFAGISPHAPDALEELERCVRDWGFKGVALDPGWCSPALRAADAVMESVFDLCRQLGVTISIALSAYGGPDLSYVDPSPLAPLLKRFPEVRVVIAHGAWPKVQEALGLAMTHSNLYLAPDCYLYIRNMPFSGEYVRAANSFLKYRLLFSTSYPIRGFAQSLENWRACGLDPDSLQYSLYENAAELLDL